MENNDITKISEIYKVEIISKGDNTIKQLLKELILQMYKQN